MSQQWHLCRTFKVEHVKQSPWAEACWYFPDSREQFRLGGDLVIVGPDHPDAHLREVMCLQAGLPALHPPLLLRWCTTQQN